MRLVRVADRLSYGDGGTCSRIDDGSLGVVHACRMPCFRRAVAYPDNLPETPHHHLICERGHHLFLNLIDPPEPRFAMPCFQAFLRFVDREISDREVLIHCNWGESRAPSLALLYMAKRLGTLPDDSYERAAEAFRSQFPYRPGQGISHWLAGNWERIG
jgi:protein-tyrosine phosphatase